jgi:uncharacterized membrane protein
MPRWVVYALGILSLAGLGVSAYLTVAHYDTKVALACPSTALINCERVTTSPYSNVFGVPVAVLGLLFYLVFATINFPKAFSIPTLNSLRLAMASMGVLFVLYLVYVELDKVGSICLWCTSVHLITFVSFLIILYARLTYPHTIESERTNIEG